MSNNEIFTAPDNVYSVPSSEIVGKIDLIRVDAGVWNHTAGNYASRTYTWIKREHIDFDPNLC